MEDPVPAPVFEAAEETIEETAKAPAPEEAVNDFAWVVEEAADTVPELLAEDTVPEDFYKVPGSEELQDTGKPSDESDFIAIE